MGEDQGDKQDDGEEGDDHQHHVGCRVSSGGCNRWKIHIKPLNNGANKQMLKALQPENQCILCIPVVYAGSPSPSTNTGYR